MKDRFQVYRRKMAAWMFSGMLMVSAAATGCGQKKVDYDINNTQSGQTEAGKEQPGAAASGNNLDQGDLWNTYQIPFSCDTELSVGDSGLSGITIKTDAVSVPEISELYTVSYKRREPESNAYKKELAESLFDKDAGIYAYDSGNRCKKDIQAEIDRYKDEKENYPDPVFADFYDNWISELETELEQAPDSYPAADDYSADAFIGYADGKEYELDYKTSSLYRSFNIREDLIQYRPKESAVRVSAYEEDDYVRETGDTTGQFDTVSNACAGKKDQLQTKAEDFLSTVGAVDVALQSCQDLYWVYTDASGATAATDIDGYVMTFVRAIDKQPVSAMEYNRVENLQDQEDVSALPVEKYEIRIDSNGIISADWCDYLETTGESTKTEILSFPELLKKADKTVADYYKKYPSQYGQIAFKNVALTYYLTAGNRDGVFEYKPVWIFSACEEDSDPDYPNEMVVLDATDGSCIDLIEISKALGSLQY